MSAPLLSIIIPTWRRPAQLGACLHSLSLQQPPAEGYEILVVVDSEDPDDAGGAQAWLDKLPLRILFQPHAGCGPARNRGAEAANGRVLLFTDDDCLFPDGWLLTWAAAVNAHPDAIVAGPSFITPQESNYSAATQAIMDFLFHAWNSDPHNARFAVGNNLGIPAQGFTELGRFGANYRLMAAEDRDFCARWRAAGRRIVYVPALTVRHCHDLTLHSFLRQHVHYGRGAGRFHRLRAASNIPEARLEPGSFYFQLITSPFHHSHGRSAFALAALLLLSQLAHTFGYFQERLTAPPLPERPS